MPEYIQGEATGAKLSQAVLARLEDDNLRGQEKAGLLEQVVTMRQTKSGPASHRAAEKLLQFLDA